VVQADSAKPTDDALAPADAVSTWGAPSGQTPTLPGRLTPEELAALDAGAPRPTGDGDYLFTLDEPDAGFVSVAGTFNGWIPTQHHLVRRDSLGGEDGLWYGLIALPRGRHLYKYLVDGNRWVTDPANKQVTRDGFGSSASVVVVP
jgi:1,4-alpha-glucan branching enzyme